MQTRKLESSFQSSLIKELKRRFKDCVVHKNDGSYLQGFPDILILKGKQWAALECKRNASARVRPNQQYYVDLLNSMSFARFIFPENKEEVLRELEQTFGIGGQSRLSFRK